MAFGGMGWHVLNYGAKVERSQVTRAKVARIVRYFRPYWRGYYRHYRLGGGWGHDPAVETARERYARGEITADQLDEIFRELAKVSSPLPPS